MPNNLLFIENDIDLINEYANILDSNLKIKYHVIKNFQNFQAEITSNNYSHIIVNSEVDKNWFDIYQHLIKVPVLVISNTEKDSPFYYVTNKPLSFDKIFSFICETSSFSTKTLEEYSLGEEDVLAELVKQIGIEFNQCFVDLPKLINSRNLKDIESKVHTISTKFSLLEMENPYNDSKEIESKIFEDTENQLVNCENLLLDIAIVINQIKN